ncbi:DNA-3-methyladenine glycosylase II [Nocardia transvalensis]|uniref:DNA-3-methyladenine glycosylase II n=1 Tax=Nocardia transvalensis TaxID=37333 RepID=A0A7W9UJW8_9NOCA|nr:hypothetical protein [Nocardia transvalensis]MBB5915105.1 DNA-3-methyladenine glycosylase II [Nocardia transvalensis]
MLVTATRADSGDPLVDLGGGSAHIDRVDPSALSGPDDLIAPLKAAGVVARVANPSLWDALSAAIMRQVIRADHARTRYVRFCTCYGQAVTRDELTAWLFPTPERILTLTDDEFQTVGAKFPMPALRAAAGAYLERGDQWATLPAVDLVTALQSIPRIGAWTARTTVADYTNDFSHYDYSDIAVQPAARQLNPDREWPQGAPAFKAAWEEVAGNQLSAWTLLTLAWGIRHGKPADRSRTS